MSDNLNDDRKAHEPPTETEPDYLRDEEKKSAWKSGLAFLYAPFTGKNKKNLYVALILLAGIFAMLAAINIFVSPREPEFAGTPEIVADQSLTYRSAPSQESTPSAEPESKAQTEPETTPGEVVTQPEETREPAQTEAPPKKMAEPQPSPAVPEKSIVPPPAPRAKPPVTHAPGAYVEGAAFVAAIIKTLDDEINQTSFGWRPNSFLFGKLRLTDNVNNRQLGVLETVRVVTLTLKEKISRYGDADAFNPNLESALNYFMNSAYAFWFPSADEQFNKGLNEMRKYLANLQSGKANFYPRSDNFEALIEACKELVGNCHHNLVKRFEADGESVSMWNVDNYFYYAQGVALAMGQILEAALTDFKEELILVKGTALLQEVVTHLKQAAALDPWIVLDGPLDGLRANHRANMAVPVGEALFKLTNLLRY